ncbi:PdaC/SigV domain-containing protein [Paenibacillus sacheonensis]|uniref:DUF4163 domain-containing protein n=1 Tax=Paenibacillus sacheonensis TaxID=742054 RepID=A0A7X4YS64_9BACL|nr:DUF4163 domain-containing protein [Paenibacillus sacheonensis]MBM7566921.1 lipoprotein-anchoring transpeptidase ErfK/SrfK [Paenibacillus sacheonensis]NBC71543.1 DUF4163 domain-containing protein [Paenibacillus sacheonensis]
MDNQRKRSPYRKPAIAALSAAALSTALLLSVSAPYAFAASASDTAPASDEPIASPIAVAQPIVAAQPIAAANPAADAVKITFKSVQQSTKQLETDLQVPVISGMKDTAYQNTLNANIAARAKAAVDAITKQAAKDYAANDGSYEFRPYGITVRYELVSDGSADADGILSFKVLTYTYTGGAHGGTYAQTYNVRNAAKASSIKLKELFGPSYKTILGRAATAEVNAFPDDYFASKNVAIADSQSFVIKDGLAFIIFQEYEIAPYAAGMPEIAAAIPGSSAIAPAAAAKLPIVADGKTVKGAVVLPAAAGNLMAPLRAVAAALGFEVRYDAKSHETMVSKGSFTASVMQGKDRYAYGDFQAFALGAAPSVKGGVLYVPLNFFSAGLNADLAYTTTAITLNAAK